MLAHMVYFTLKDRSPAAVQKMVDACQKYLPGHPGVIFFAAGTVAMAADWTRPDPIIAAYLKSYGRYGIPFNAVYGPSAPQGIALSELLTPDDVLSALLRARNPANAGIAPQSPPSGG